MKHIVVMLFFTLAVFSQKTTESIVSNKLGGTREITIGLPPSYEKNPNKKYPILVLLDGDYLFDPFFGNLNFGAYWDDLPEIIIVGINQGKKDQRFADSNYDELQNVPSKKGAAFFEFIGGELLPYIEKKYRVAPFRIIAGNDTTAGYLNFFLYKDKPLFNAYISLSPELVPQMDVHIPDRLSKLKDPIFYYQSTCDGDFKEMLESVTKLDDNIKQITNASLNYKYDHFNRTSHYACVLFSIPSALYQIFEIYQPISLNEYNEKIAILPSGQVKYLTDKYDKIEKIFGLKAPVRISDFKAIEASILKNKTYQELDKLSEIAQKSYPKSMLGDYELALMYEHLGDVKRAAKSYQNAAQLEEIGDLTKEIMFEKFDEMQSKIKKK